jgi:hypothetical protein
VDLRPVDPASAATRCWSADLDEPWREAFRQAWDAFRTGNVAVGACASTADGEILHAARNRLNAFATLIARLSQPLTQGFEQAVRALGDGSVLDLMHDLRDGGEADRLAAMEVDEALRYLWPRLQRLAGSPGQTPT